MPTIPIYRQQQSVGGVPNLGRVSTEAMTAGARGAQEIAGAVDNVLNERRKEQLRIEEEDAKVYAGKVIADSQLKWREEMLNRQSSAEPGAPDFTPNVLKDFDAYSQQAIGNAPTEASRRFIQSQMLDLRTRIGGAALEYESGARVQYRFQQQSDTIDAFAQNIAQAPNEATIAEAMANIEQTMPDVGPANQAKLREMAQVKFRQAAWLSQLQTDPDGVKAQIDQVFKPKNTVADLRATDADPATFGQAEGGRAKGAGFLGPLKRPDGSVSTEISIGVNIDGKEMEIPTLVPTLSRAEVETLLSLPDDAEMPESIVQKAVAFARERTKKGLPAFAQEGELFDIGGRSVAANSGDAIEFILGIEGGRVENDAGAGLTNFGINSRANPDVDVANLTPEKAAKVYKERYWDAINADALPPDVALMAFDAAVNQGPAFARELIEESGGDVVEMARMRRERYDEIVAADPSKAQYLKGWMGRVDKVKKKALAMNVVEPVKINGDEKVSWSSGLVRMTPVDELIRYRQQAEQAIKQRQQVVVDTMRMHLTDASAMAESGIPDPNPLTAPDFAVFGDQAAMMYQQYNRTQRLARDISGFTDATNADLFGVVQGLTPEAQPGEGFAAAQKRDSVRKQAALRVLEMREQDPAGYVAKTVPSVQQAVQATMAEDATPEQRQAATQRAVMESIAAQERLGVRNPKILSAGQAQGYGESILMAATPEDVSDFVAGIEQQYGTDNFRRVMGELMQANKLPPALMIIPDLDSPAAREMVARMSFVKAEQLKVGIDKDDLSRLRDRVSEKVGELAATIPATSQNNAKLLEAYQETTEKISMQLMQNGIPFDVAVDRAANLLWAQKYEMDGSIRKPKGIEYNVQDRAAARLQEDAATYDIPPDLFQARTDDEAREEWVDTIRSNAKWYTAPDGKGVQLWASGNDGVLYRVTRDGQQVTYSFDDLRGQSVVPKAQRSRMEAFRANQQRAQELNRLRTEAAQ